MKPPLNRREALAGLCTLGLGRLLGACGNRGDAPSSAPTTSTVDTDGARTVATAAPTTTVPPLVGRFDAVASCSLTPEQIAGPSYIAVDAIRSDMREDLEGTTLRLGLRVLDEACAPLADAVVEAWNCDAQGLYSAYRQRSGDTTGQTFCRGTQVTDANGIVEFLTIYPGWYRTRTTHLHAKVHLGNAEILATQLYLDDEVTGLVYESAAYASHPGRDTFNDSDRMFDPATMLAISPEGDGYLGLLNLVVRPA